VSVVLFASAAESVLLFPQSVTFHGFIDWRAETAHRFCPKAKRKENLQRQIADQTATDLSSCADSCATSFTICYALFVTREAKSFVVHRAFKFRNAENCDLSRKSLVSLLYFNVALSLFI